MTGDDIIIGVAAGTALGVGIGALFFVIPRWRGRRGIQLALAAIAVVAGVAMFVWAALETRQRDRLASSGEKATGVVVGQECHRSGTGASATTRCMPRVRFTDQSGASTEVVSRSGSLERRESGRLYTRFREGDPVELVFPAGEPQKAELVAFLYMWPAGLRAIGTGCVVFGLCLLGAAELARRRRR